MIIVPLLLEVEPLSHPIPVWDDFAFKNVFMV